MSRKKNRNKISLDYFSRKLTRSVFLKKKKKERKGGTLIQKI